MLTSLAAGKNTNRRYVKSYLTFFDVKIFVWKAVGARLWYVYCHKECRSTWHCHFSVIWLCEMTLHRDSRNMDPEFKAEHWAHLEELSEHCLQQSVWRHSSNWWNGWLRQEECGSCWLQSLCLGLHLETTFRCGHSRQFFTIKNHLSWPSPVKSHNWTTEIKDKFRCRLHFRSLLL